MGLTGADKRKKQSAISLLVLELRSFPAAASDCPVATKCN